MTGQDEEPRTSGAVRRWSSRMWKWWQRALETPGYERHTLLLVGKSTLAATLAWLVSYYALHAPSPAFAPFSAVLMMQVTVYQSLLQSLRYVAAVAVGVLMVSGLGFLIGSDLLAFVLVAVAGLTIGRWPRLGSQGSQVATGAFFAFSTYALAPSDSEKAAQLGQIVLLVLIGCGIGVIVNLTVAPPIRYRSAEYGLRSLSAALGDLVGDIYPVLRDNEIDSDRCGQWYSRAERTGGMITQARDGFRTAKESLYYNPRLLLRRQRGAKVSFEGYGAVLEALVRALYQVTSLTRSLHQWTERERRLDDGAFFARYADFLECVSRITDVLAGIDEDSLAEQSRELGGHVDRAQDAARELAEEAARSGLPLADPARPYGALMVEANRLMGEFLHTRDVLKETR
ncbi:FUSC family protein [Streptomyces flavofungini]|uniref:FUSC family protein n=1 Tax=Streptomyces flavofungini TaxID=68200 RepID=UPI0034E03DE8